MRTGGALRVGKKMIRSASRLMAFTAGYAAKKLSCAPWSKSVLLNVMRNTSWSLKTVYGRLYKAGAKFCFS